ncbi:hypothetical protein SPRG_13576 [Saprolegnia parasitica CBS 223.65]|uniref:PPM-type phosphatase domain-containing protein n=1 Tax=Saprolegnia parasitica (strain CBS 223.65) TaxID=695850 RepID=A0A067C3B0_SAPPC|nr:hypothetical protein SPRG_13576 [Saprolegnia parasitica CBS 223.65]KDO21277.1 hypothetical protein SPRG_13576 [Saprolegnia parasitica CBS 223.65]|eukprot:XP_012208020.1 hypothetical protein SPRG_13576 [Saprolegnia parasitica CBS 223.65]
MAEAFEKQAVFRRLGSSVQTAAEAKGARIVIAASGTTDIGSARCAVNQDTYMALDVGGGNVVLGVFDGHGKETGHIAAEAAKAFFTSHFESPEALAAIEAQPEAELRSLFAQCHAHLYSVFQAHYATLGLCTRDDSLNGRSFLLQRKGPSQPYTCVQGGTTATLAILLHGTRLLVANVGDSSALLAGAGSVRITPLHALADAPIYCPHAPSASPNPCEIESSNNSNNNNNSDTLHHLISGDHSAESRVEFDRVITSDVQGLQFLYDAPCVTNRLVRVPIFTKNSAGDIVKSAGGRYYKNVRNEWASMVAAPIDAAFADCLAFTRSLGDFHLHAHGLSWQPDVLDISLFDDPTSCSDVAIVLATDGVWDVWHYDELAQFVLQTKDEGDAPEIDAKARARRLLQENLAKAHTIFGDQADNMTAVLCYLSRA